MDTRVFANGAEICSKAADGESMVNADPCWSPPAPSAGPIVTVYSNTAKANQLKDGSETVFICGTPLAVKNKSYLGNSTGNEGATYAFAKGVVSGVIKGKAYFVDWSPNVKVEGLNVCRHEDPMTHNHA